jgi:hypothetical protein
LRTCCTPASGEESQRGTKYSCIHRGGEGVERKEVMWTVLGWGLHPWRDWCHLLRGGLGRALGVG